MTTKQLLEKAYSNLEETLEAIREIQGEIYPHPREYTPDDRHIGCEVMKALHTDTKTIFRESDDPDAWRLYLGPAKLAMIPWHGGECPLKDDGIALVVDREGERWIAAQENRWNHGGDEWDIIAYREIETVGVE